METVQRTRPTAVQLMHGFRETKNTQRGVVTLTTRGGKFVVKHGTEEHTFRNLEAAQRAFDKEV